MSLFMTIIVIVPCLSFLSSMVFGGLYAASAGSEYSSGFENSIAIITGLPAVLIQQRPENHFSKTVVWFVSVWHLLFSSLAIGAMGSMIAATCWVRSAPVSCCGLLRYLGLYMPAAILATGAALGSFLALMEEWPWADGFLYMTGRVCGLGNPLVGTTPQHASGYFLLALSFVAELGLRSFVVAFAWGSPHLQGLARLLEGARPPTADEARAAAEIAALRAEVEKLTQKLNHNSVAKLLPRAGSTKSTLGIKAPPNTAWSVKPGNERLRPKTTGQLPPDLPFVPSHCKEDDALANAPELQRSKTTGGRMKRSALDWTVQDLEPLRLLGASKEGEGLEPTTACPPSRSYHGTGGTVDILDLEGVASDPACATGGLDTGADRGDTVGISGLQPTPLSLEKLASDVRGDEPETQSGSSDGLPEGDDDFIDEEEFV